MLLGWLTCWETMERRILAAYRGVRRGGAGGTAKLQPGRELCKLLTGSTGIRWTAWRAKANSRCVVRWVTDQRDQRATRMYH